jgi:hypothetical protein
MSRQKKCTPCGIVSRPSREPGDWWGIGKFKAAFELSAADVEKLIAGGALEYKRSRVRTRYDGRTSFGDFIVRRSRRLARSHA